MKGFKKFIITIFAAMMLLSASIFPVAAKVPVNNSNIATEQFCISDEDFRWHMAQSIAENANNTIEALVADAQQSRRPNIRLLILKTDLISRTAISLIRTLGYDAVCLYEKYEIHGQLVEIDPIIVIKR